MSVRAEYLINGEIFSIQPVSAACGGSYGWFLKTSTGAWISQGCICHNVPGANIERLVNEKHHKHMTSLARRVLRIASTHRETGDVWCNAQGCEYRPREFPLDVNGDDDTPSIRNQQVNHWLDVLKREMNRDTL